MSAYYELDRVPTSLHVLAHKISTSEVLLFPFKDEEAETWGCLVFCPRSHHSSNSETGIELICGKL